MILEQEGNNSGVNSSEKFNACIISIAKALSELDDPDLAKSAELVFELSNYNLPSLAPCILELNSRVVDKNENVFMKVAIQL